MYVRVDLLGRYNNLVLLLLQTVAAVGLRRTQRMIVSHVLVADIAIVYNSW